jgi:queuosine precursor transporter
MIYIALYLGAIVAANLSVAYFGPSASIVNAFLFIGLDLSSRDNLHDAWGGRGLWWKMGALILAGSALSFALNRNAGPIALASLAAFAASATVDAVAYQLLKGKARLLRVNGSNILGAVVDSVIFPVLAFGWPPMIAIMTGQFIAKVAGGFIWSLILRRAWVAIA